MKCIYLFKNVFESDSQSIKSAGFNTILVFRVSVLPNGDLVYISSTNENQPVHTLIAADGGYVGGSPLAQKIASFKAPPTIINRVEVSLGSHDGTFQTIKEVMNDSEAALRIQQHFAALKSAWQLDAVNLDDEEFYDLDSSVKFAIMLGQLGYHVSFSPCNSPDFWNEAKERLNIAAPNVVDAIYLQCYDLGLNNQPDFWQSRLNMKVIPLLWVSNDYRPEEGNSPEQARELLNDWHTKHTLAGGGFWNDFDIEKKGISYHAYGSVLNQIFKDSQPEREVRSM